MFGRDPVFGAPCGSDANCGDVELLAGAGAVLRFKRLDNFLTNPLEAWQPLPLEVFYVVAPPFRTIRRRVRDLRILEN